MFKKALKFVVLAACLILTVAGNSFAAKPAVVNYAHDYVATLPIEAGIKATFAGMLPNNREAAAIVKSLDIKAINTALEKALAKSFTPNELKMLVGTTKGVKTEGFKKLDQVRDVLASTLQKELEAAVDTYYKQK